MPLDENYAQTFAVARITYGTSPFQKPLHISRQLSTTLVGSPPVGCMSAS
jgi:hypothetical protein